MTYCMARNCVANHSCLLASHSPGNEIKITMPLFFQTQNNRNLNARLIDKFSSICNPLLFDCSILKL